MLFDALLAALHTTSVIATIALLAIEAVFASPRHIAAAAPHLRRIDLFYFAAALAALASGLMRAFLGAKGASFYADNPWFWAKLTVFGVIGALSIKPTLHFARWAKRIAVDPAFVPPPAELAQVRRWIGAEFVFVAILPVLAALMARAVALQARTQ